MNCLLNSLLLCESLFMLSFLHVLHPSVVYVTCLLCLTALVVSLIHEL